MEARRARGRRSVAQKLWCEHCGTAFVRPAGARGVSPRFCSSACRSRAARRRTGKVVENTHSCSSCGVSLAGQQANATLCTARRCHAWNARHPGTPHPSTKLRHCAWCGVSIGHRRANAEYCGRECSQTALVDRSRGKLNAQRRERWAERPALQEHAREYRQTNAERRRQWARAARERNTEQYRAYFRAWRAKPENYARVLLNNHNRREMARNHPDSVGVSLRDWQRLVRRYGGRCAYCSAPVEKPDLDHVVPIARGGRHAIGNVLPACPPCNARKQAQLLSVWRYRRGAAVAM
ncbi:MAG: hypothetical protein JWO67_6951 [Streptosporangiaceae bacterium]|nr:hypothetical protein [Streptosporangiaceae bacterium]